MKRSSVLKILAFVGVLAATGAKAQVWNFHNMANQQGNTGGYIYHSLFVGQGAYSDPGNNIWNGFGVYPGPGQEYVYGPSRPYTAYGGGNPGNPYAAWKDTSGWHTGSGYPVTFGSGGTIDGSGNPTGVQAANVTSAGLASRVTLSISYDHDNGLADVNVHPANGTPGYLVGEAAVAPPGITGTFTLHNVPAGTYDLFLYGANYDDDRGARFIVDGQTVIINNNPGLDGQHPGTTFDLGANYTIIHGINPDGSGDITGTWDGQFTNPLTGQSGEGDFNGLQLVTVPEPSMLALLGFGLTGAVIARRRK